jgi:hypothetical protein
MKPRAGHHPRGQVSSRVRKTRARLPTTSSSRIHQENSGSEDDTVDGIAAGTAVPASGAVCPRPSNDACLACGVTNQSRPSKPNVRHTSRSCLILRRPGSKKPPAYPYSQGLKQREQIPAQVYGIRNGERRNPGKLTFRGVVRRSSVQKAGTGLCRRPLQQP